MRPLACSAAVTACAVAVAMPLAGCGSGDDEAEIRALFGDVRLAHAHGDYAAVCESMSGDAKRQIAAMGHGPATGGCVPNLAEKLAATVPSRRDRLPARIEEVAVDGDEATLTATLGGGPPTAIRFERDDGDWRLARVFDTSGPPAPDMR